MLALLYSPPPKSWPGKIAVAAPASPPCEIFTTAVSSGITMETEKGVVGPKKSSINVGPWGGHGGTSWDDGCHSGVREITVSFDRCIDSIQVQYDKNGKPVLGNKHGGTGGTHTAQIKLNYPEEFLTTISGHISPVVRGGLPVIRSLTFKSNQKTHGPFGVDDGTPFMFPIDGDFIVGFSGRSGWHLDAIGFHLSCPRNPNLFDKLHQKLQKLAVKSLGQYGWEKKPQAKTNKAA